MRKKKIISILIAAIVIIIALPIKPVAIPELNTTSYGYTTSEKYTPVLKEDASKVTAIGTHRNFGWMMGTTLDFEGFFGIRIDTSDPVKPKYSVYSHNPIFTYSEITINGRNLSGATINEWYPIDISGLQDDVYDINLVFTTAKNEKMKVKGYFGVEDGKAYTCRKLNNFLTSSKKQNWDVLMKDVNPKDYLSTEELCYPTLNGYHCVIEYQMLADKIAKPNWTDEAKVFAFVKYITENYAYDYYKIKKGASRAALSDNYDDPYNFTYANHVGVCWDFTNILTIMCRQHGIPCTSLDNKAHTINAVYMNSEWVAIDVTALVVKECDSENTSEKYWYRAGQADWRKYGFYEPMPYVNYEIWTWSTNKEKYESSNRPKINYG